MVYLGNRWLTKAKDALAAKTPARLSVGTVVLLVIVLGVVVKIFMNATTHGIPQMQK
jgi:hypothetical protein